MDKLRLFELLIKLVVELFFYIKPIRKLLKNIPIFAPYVYKKELIKRAIPWRQEELVKGVRRREIDIVEKFLKAGMTPNAQDGENNTGLIVASGEGYIEIVRLLLKQDSININVKNNLGHTALIATAINKHDNIVDLLLEHNASEEGLKQALAIKEIEEKHYDFTNEMFLRLVEFNYSDDVKTFLFAGMNPNIFDENGNTALIIASSNEHTVIVKYLLEYKDQININAKNRLGHTALIEASINRHNDIVQLLMDSGASTEGLLEVMLLEEAKKGDESAVHGLLDKGVDINCKDYSSGKTPLMIAAEYGHNNIVNLLISKKVNINERTRDGSTALILAAWNGHKDIVKMLIYCNADVNIQDNLGRNALMGAIYNDDTVMEKLLYNAKAIPSKIPEVNLLHAVREGNLQKVKDLLKRANVNISDKQENTPLILAAAKGHKEIVEELLARVTKAHLNTKNKNGNTALMEATRLGHIDIVKMLLMYGADIDATNLDNESALILASSEGWTNMVELLLENKPDVKIAKNDGSTALSIVCNYGFPDIAQSLIQNDAKVDIPIIYGYSPFMLASLAGHKEIVKLLKEAQAERGINESELFMAVISDDEKRVKELMNYQIDLEAKDKDGKTVLMKATEEGHENILKILIDNGANILEKDRYGRIPLMVVASKGFVEALDLFIQKLSKISPGQKIKDLTSPALLESAKNGHAEATRFLIENGKADVNFHYKHNDTPLILASSQGHYEVVRILLENPEIEIDKIGKNNNTAWMAAYLNGHNEIAGLLADKGANFGIREAKLLNAAKSDDIESVDWIKSNIAQVENINVRDREGITPLMWASKKGKLDVVRKLLEFSGEDAPKLIEAKTDSDKTALMFASENGHFEIVKELLSHVTNDIQKEKVICEETIEKRTALMEACKNGHLRIAQILLDNLEEETKKAEVDAQDKYLNTPLKEALLHGHERIANYLMEIGATKGKKEALFLKAASECNFSEMERLIAQNVDVNVKGKNWKTPLMIVIEQGCDESVEALIDAGANVELLDRAHKTALIIAAENGHTSVVSLLLDKGGANPNGGVKYSKNALIEAARKGHKDIVDMLLGKNAYINIRGQNGETPLIAATKEKREEIINDLCNIETLDKEARDLEGRTALMIAHLHGNLTHILEKDLDVRNSQHLDQITEAEKILLNSGTRKGWNDAELIHAASKCEEEWIIKLLGEGININAKDLEGNTALLISARNGCSEIVEKLIKTGANPDAKNKINRTPLMEAAKCRHSDVVEKLIESVEVDVRDEDENTALLEASKVGDFEIVKHLKEAGADINIRNKEGETPLIVSSRQGNCELVEYLLNQGANIIDSTIQGRKALMEAAENGNLEVLKTLLHHLKVIISEEESFKIEIHNVDWKDKTALDLAYDNKHKKCVEELKKSGALERDNPDIDKYIPNPKVWVTPFGEKFHKFTCSYLYDAKSKETLESKTKKQAILENYKPCTRYKS